MKAQATKKREEDDIRRDWEKLDNAAKGAKKGDTRAVLSVKPTTAEGKVRHRQPESGARRPIVLPPPSSPSPPSSF